MFNLSATRAALRAPARAFSTSAVRGRDMAKLTLIGRLGQDPEVRVAKNDAEYVTYTVGTSTSRPAPDSDTPATQWHRIVAFNSTAKEYLTTVKKGSLVFVEADYDVRQPDPEASPDTPEGQRMILLRHRELNVLRAPYSAGRSEGEAH
ncbi:uncharacterized protein BXZ73DRAFT_102711 [Epithele typhae]|uniref:uncharacterized protein n=1 Tax=Epithele typhae TaxID=378194 RepID=UPI002007B00A|nr:uncharacterized protein BXZ73DRAFT_102711 [Epithele typhae]KAH9927123.1 hypothetical protein BXZ73DRAFT_102711 [Epithele typhae]